MAIIRTILSHDINMRNNIQDNKFESYFNSVMGNKSYVIECGFCNVFVGFIMELYNL